jgi:hypothetical protein
MLSLGLGALWQNATSLYLALYILSSHGLLNYFAPIFLRREIMADEWSWTNQWRYGSTSGAVIPNTPRIGIKKHRASPQQSSQCDGSKFKAPVCYWHKMLMVDELAVFFFLAKSHSRFEFYHCNFWVVRWLCDCDCDWTKPRDDTFV